jgi:hypothetical protein
MHARSLWLPPASRRYAPARRGVAALVLVLAPACTETPLDATLLETDETPIMTEVPGCVAAAPEPKSVYTIVSNPTGRCLRSGEVTAIEGAQLGTTGYTVELVACDGSREQEWLLLGTAIQLQIQHALLGLNLDLEGGEVADGTEALLYYAHGNRNQLFRLNPLTDDSQEIRATSADDSCLEAMISSENAVELHGCLNVATPSAPYQSWFFAEADCDESAD